MIPFEQELGNSGNKKLPFNKETVQQNQPQGGAAICHDQLGGMIASWDPSGGTGKHCWLDVHLKCPRRCSWYQRWTTLESQTQH